MKLKQQFTSLMKEKMTFAQAFLTVLYTVIILASNIIAVKMIKLPFNFIGINYITAAVIVYPLSIIMSDIFTEVFHYRYSRITCYIAFLMNLLMVGIFALMKAIPAAFPGEALAGFESMILDTFPLLVASFVSFIVGDFMNDYVFSKLKGDNKTTKGYSFRALASTACGQVLDSTIYFVLGFGVLNILLKGCIANYMTWGNLFTMVLLQLIIKVTYEAILLPITKLLVNKLNKFNQDNQTDFTQDKNKNEKSESEDESI